ncbi:TadE/TadG family type IV pilus assembly protein [Caldalkalibacillus salinus]|uniref:TadE/TadG family type IV pilus assembly protein n=1 Tax=Caldalkalibacillus salinus TaxID=2803787 RepID=UPI001F2A53F5|nr:TadE family protein [Caldalkalibacillus salinus]
MMKRIWRNSLVKDQKGQSLLEFAIVIPLLLLLVIGIFDFGRVMYTYMQVNITTQEAARLGGLGNDDETIEQHAKNNLHLGNPEKLIVKTNPSYDERGPGDYMTVQLEYPVNFITPFMNNILNSPHIVHADSTIRVE